MCIQHKVVSKKKNETFIDFFMIPEETFDHENVQKKLVVDGTEGWGEGGARRTGWGDGDGNGEGEVEGGGGRRIGWGDGMDFGWENGRSCFCFFFRYGPWVRRENSRRYFK